MNFFEKKVILVLAIEGHSLAQIQKFEYLLLSHTSREQLAMKVINSSFCIKLELLVTVNKLQFHGKQILKMYLIDASLSNFFVEL